MTPSKTQREKELKRLHILKSAGDLFLEKGYEHTSVSEIVRAAGVAQGTFYLYFQSKEDLLIAMADHIFDQAVEHVLAAVKNVSPPLVRIEAAIKETVAHFAGQQEVMTLLHTGTAAASVGQPERMVALLGKFVFPLADWIREGIERGEIRPQDPVMAAHFIVTMVHEVTERAFCLNYPGPIEEVLPSVLDFVRFALQAAPNKE